MRCFIWDLNRPSEIITALNELRQFGEIQFVIIANGSLLEMGHFISEIESLFKALKLPGEEFLFDLTDNLKCLIVKRKIDSAVDVVV